MKSLSIAFTAILVGFLLGTHYVNYKNQNTDSPLSLTAEAPSTKLTGIKYKKEQIESKLKKLEEENKSLLARLEEKTKEIHSERLEYNKTTALLSKKIDNAPEFVIKKQLKKYFDEKSLTNISDIRAFSKKLTSMALEDEPDLSPENIHIDVQFSKSPMLGKYPFSQTVTVNKYDMLFAHFTSTSDANDIVIKWQDIETGEIIAFKSISLTARASSPYITARPIHGWRQTSYRVTVSRMNDNVTPLGTNAYTVLQVIDDGRDGTEPNQEIIDDLIATGQAVSKNQ